MHQRSEPKIADKPLNIDGRGLPLVSMMSMVADCRKHCMPPTASLGLKGSHCIWKTIVYIHNTRNYVSSGANSASSRTISKATLAWTGATCSDEWLKVPFPAYG
jgi:hypothetical protein